MKLNKITVLFIFLWISIGYSQEILTKEEALKITLKNNFGIVVAKNNQEIAKNNASIYNSRLLPTVTANSNATYRRDNQSVTFQDSTRPTVEVTGAETKSYNASLGVNYIIFDGLGRKYNYQQLKETYNLSELQAKETIENVFLQLFTGYFQIARLTDDTNNLKEILAISKKRLLREKYKYEYGQSDKLAYLNAEVDVNNDSITYVNAQQQLLNAKRNLNIILGVEKGVKYQVETDVNYNTLLNYKDLENKVLVNNTSIKQSKQNVAISEFNLKLNKSNYLPSLGVNASYDWNSRFNPPTQFASEIMANGLNLGVNLTWNLFDGGTTKTRVANAKIAIENNKVLLAQQKAAVVNNFKNIWANYKNQLFVLKAQETNVLTNKNNFNRTQERFKLGQVSSLVFRQAQVNLFRAKTGLNKAKFDAKLIELQLLQLTGDILNIKL